MILGRQLTAVLVICLVATTEADGSPASRARVHLAFEHAYDLQLAACYEALAQAAVLDPADPAPPRAAAAVAWVEILFAQGIATFEAFTGQLAKGDVIRPAAPLPLQQRFRAQLDRARQLAEERLHRSANADSYYQVGATLALSALYKATVEGRTLGAFTEGRRAVKAMERARALDPKRPEPALVLGLYRYTVSTLSLPLRLLAGFSGLSGSRDEGLALLGEASSPQADTAQDALVLLMIIYNREGRHADALAVLERLERASPHNRLFMLNAAATALEAHDFPYVERDVSRAFAAYPRAAEPTVLGEEALWFLKRGIARAELGLGGARSDLTTGLAASPRDWVRARLHAALGKLDAAEGSTGSARTHFAAALDFGDRGGDVEIVREARQLLKRGGK